MKENNLFFSFAPPWVRDPKFSIDWLYSALQHEWSRWLPSTTTNTVRQGAYYSTILKPGFKIISLNMNYCNNKNWCVTLIVFHCHLCVVLNRVNSLVWCFQVVAVE